MYLEYTKPKPIDWTPTYSSKDKIPLGTYILSKEISRLFPDKNLKIVEETPASYLNNQENEESNSLYFIINQDSHLSETDSKALLNFVKNGNDVFIVSLSPPKQILDSLKTEVKTSYYVLKEDFSNVWVYLTNPVFSKKQFNFEKVSYYSYFNKIDSAKSVILGEYTAPGEKRTNFIRQKYGNGYFYIHLLPEAYSNYFMLNDNNYTYAINSINYINKKNILWEENKKSIDSPSEDILMYILNNPPLLWAWRIIIVSSIFYCIFFGKRLQRKIPIINPLKNTTVEFTKTIGNLYYNNREHQDIIQKKIKYFLYFIKEHYFMDIDKIDDNFSEKLHLKSGVSKEVTDKIVSLIQKNQESSPQSEEDLKTINSIIDLFYKKIK